MHRTIFHFFNQIALCLITEQSDGAGTQQKWAAQTSVRPTLYESFIALRRPCSLRPSRHSRALSARGGPVAC